MDSTTILYISRLILACGGLLMLLTGKHRTASEGMQTVLHGIIQLIAVVC